MPLVILGSMLTLATAQTVAAITSSTTPSDSTHPAASQTAEVIVATNKMIHPVQSIEIRVGVNPIAEAEEKAKAEAAAKKAEEERAKREAEEKAAQEAAAQKAAQEAARQAEAKKAQQQAASTTTTKQGTFKLSFYDPAVLGSNMGYGGVAANLSVFPRGTQLKITLSDGTVWYRVVNDTGGFAASNPNQLDVAMPNSQIPAAGILYATVEVVG